MLVQDVIEYLNDPFECIVVAFGSGELIIPLEMNN